MKIKEKRRDISRKRQVFSQQLKTWNQSIADLEQESLRDPAKADALKEKLVFCRQERDKCRQTLKELEQGVHLQRCWASGKIPQ
jgi:uncharacterized coiled-coil DUF342 family protein